MRRFEVHEMNSRAQLISIVSNIHSAFNKKKALLSEDWKEEFNKGKIKQVEEQFNSMCDIVDSQIKLIADLAELINKQEQEIHDSGTKPDKHTRYSDLVKAHFGFTGPDGELVDKAELESVQILEFLRKINLDLQEQKKILDALKKKGAGQQAYSEIDLRELTKTEYSLLQHVEPFWHDWEALTVKIESMISRLEGLSDDEIDKAEDEIKKLLSIYHAEFTGNERASQLGTELALNLYIQGTEEIKNLGDKIPVVLINIDMTACNSLDASHKLGDALIDTCYDELDKRLRRDFTKTGSKKKGRMIEGKGVVTVLGRTRFKIVGVPKEELKPVLEELPAVIHDIMMKKQGGRFKNTHDWDRFNQLNTVLLAGYSEISIGNMRTEFRSAIEALNFSPVDYLNEDIPIAPKGIDGRINREHLLADVKILEKRIALEIDEAVKSASAKAEYLEKEVYPKMKEALMKEIVQRRSDAGIPDVPSPVFDRQEKDILIDAAKKYPLILLYHDKIDPVLLGTNYIPEDEFEGLMISRVAHQIGMDNKFTEEFIDFLRSAKALKKDGRMDESDSHRLHELKERFYDAVLQKRHIAKSYELRFIKALREDAYDELLPGMMMIEGPQIMTFIEVDGFNAFNKLYRPDNQDTYYHSLLKLIFTKFDEVFNSGVPEDHKLSLRMTKQGDEIWLSYPLHSERGNIREKDHRKFLESINRTLMSRGDDALYVNNTRTVDWIPYLIEDKKVMEDHIQNSLQKKRRVSFVDNSYYQSTEVQQRPYVPLTPANRDKFWKGIFTLVRVANKKSADFSNWKVLDGAREITGTDFFSPMRLKTAYMLFSETLKKTVQGVSSRLNTGRIIRLGFTMGYVGFQKRPIVCKSADEVKLIRKVMNDAVEHIRKTKGRGGVHNVDKYGLQTI
ncbi:MAG: hypothetical protein ABIA62_03000 [Candidatus Woesearchaeota archaeon]